MQIAKRACFGGSGTDTMTVFVKPGPGQATCRNMYFTSPGAGTITVYLAKQDTTAHAACSASATLVIHTDSAGKIGGAVIANTDYVIIADSSGTGYQLRSVSVIAGVSSSTVSLTLGATATCAALDTIFIVRAADIAALTVGAETVKDLAYLFSGYERYPVAVVQAATGANKNFMLIDYERY